MVGRLARGADIINCTNYGKMSYSGRTIRIGSIFSLYNGDAIGTGISVSVKSIVSNCYDAWSEKKYGHYDADSQYLEIWENNERIYPTQ